MTSGSKNSQSMAKTEEDSFVDDGTGTGGKKRQKKKPLDAAQLQMKEQLEQHKELEIKKLKESN